VFRVSAEVLRAAQGDVRCGVCSTTFNALENLSEKAFKPAPEAEAPAPDDSMTVEELPGGENIELSAPVELTVVPEPPAAEPAASAAPAAHDDDDRAMEFHGSDADLDRLFVIEQPPRDIDSTDEHPIIVLEERDEEPEPRVVVETIVLETVEPEPEPPPAPRPRPASQPGGHTAPRILIPDEMRKRLAEEARSREAASELFEPAESSPGLLAERWPWVAGIASLALLLLIQVIHSQRHDLVRSPGLGTLVAGVYGLFGSTVLAPSDLAAYELRQWGAASDPNQAGRLMLRASIVNRASHAQPLPLLRLALQDRFGGTMGLRDIPPADYLPGAGGEGLLGPGERADALIRIVDPGTEAVGFELDICLPATGGVRCANQVKTARQ
jgi:predicted Zn finger-like uncharacterized protein